MIDGKNGGSFDCKAEVTRGSEDYGDRWFLCEVILLLFKNKNGLIYGKNIAPIINMVTLKWLLLSYYGKGRGKLRNVSFKYDI